MSRLSGRHEHGNTSDDNYDSNDRSVWDMVTGGLTSLYRPKVDNLIARLKSERAPDQHNQPYNDQNPTAYRFVHLQFPFARECVFGGFAHDQPPLL
jgi:hypothetical protein